MPSPTHSLYSLPEWLSLDEEQKKNPVIIDLCLKLVSEQTKLADLATVLKDMGMIDQVLSATIKIVDTGHSTRCQCPTCTTGTEPEATPETNTGTWKSMTIRIENNQLTMWENNEQVLSFPVSYIVPKLPRGGFKRWWKRLWYKFSDKMTIAFYKNGKQLNRLAMWTRIVDSKELHSYYNLHEVSPPTYDQLR